MSILTSWSQSIPEKSLQDFNQRFNNHTEATKIVWQAVDAGYEVTYEFNEREGYVFYDESGLFKVSRLSMHFEELEQGIQAYVSKNYPEAAVTYCYRLNTLTAPERSAVELSQSGNTIKLFFRPDGTFHYAE